MSSKAPRRESRALRSTAQETPIDTAEAHTVNTVIETSQEHQLATSDTAVTVGLQAPLPNDISEIDLLRMIWEKMSRMERTENNIDDKLNNVINKVSQLESAQNDLRADVTKIEQTVTYMSDTIDAMDDNKTDVRRTEFIERDISAMKERMIDLSNRARRNNLVLYNMPEGVEDTGYILEDGATDNQQDCTNASTTPASYAAAAAGTKAPPNVPIHRFVETFILRHFGLHVEVEAAHRTNTRKAPTGDDTARARPRLIHFRCVRRYDREAILRAAPVKLKMKTFKGNSIFISDDIDPATRAQHQQLVPILREMRLKKHFAFIPWSVPRVIRYKEGPKEADLPMKTYRLKITN